MESTAPDLSVALDTLWVLTCSFLVFFMNAGFGCVEAGFCRAKNATNILAKNFLVFALASLGYWAVGFGIMFAEGTPYFGTGGWFLVGADNSPATGEAYHGIFGALSWAGVPFLAKFFFQLVFAGTAATIVSGCVAERVHYGAFMLFALLLSIFCYPVTGHWIWGGGWLQSLGMWDFAGSTVVHSVGGWAGLAGILVLGPRIGKYRKDGSVSPIPGHSMALAFLGGMILWLGWFGFNPGSTMGLASNGGLTISHVTVTTNMACIVGLLVATFVSYALMGKPDFSMSVNGALAGLVAITASCAFVTVPMSVLIGAVGGLIVVFAVRFFDSIRIDDPVGALSVHLACGIWGTLAIGLFATKDAPGGITADGFFYGGGLNLLKVQAIGILSVAAYTFPLSLALWKIIDIIVPIRVSPTVEAEGLDVHEMGTEAYPHDPAIDVDALVRQSHLGRHATTIAKGLVRAPRPASQPPSAPVYLIALKGIESSAFMKRWSELCGKDGIGSDEFRSIYAHFSTVKGSELRFRGGDPQAVRKKLEAIAKKINPEATTVLLNSPEGGTFASEAA